MHRQGVRVQTWVVCFSLFAFALTACGDKSRNNPEIDGGEYTDGGENTDGGGDTDGGENTDGGGNLGSVVGNLASSQGITFMSNDEIQIDGYPTPGPGHTLFDLSIDEVSVELLHVVQGEDPDSWSVDATAIPDSNGAFSFEGLA